MLTPANDPPAGGAMNFPVFDVPQVEHWPQFIPLERVIAEMAPQWEHCMKHYDSPEKRLRTKNPKPFWLYPEPEPGH